MFCAVSGVGAELVGRAATRLGGGGDDVRAALCGVGEQRPLSWLCPFGGVERVTGAGEARLAWGMAAAATPGADRSAPPRLCECLSRARVVCALAVAAPRALGLAPGVTAHYGGHGSASSECSLSAATEVGPPARHAVGGDGHGVSGATAAAHLDAAGPLGGGLYRAVVIAHRSGAERRRRGLVWIAGLE
jgi:hypothetical protein